MDGAPFDLGGRVALVTGGNGGIGLGLAEGLAAAGAAVAIWGRDGARNGAALERLAAHGTQVAAFACDVADPAGVDVAFAQTLDAFGRVDACFANAGVLGEGTSFLETSPEQFRRVVAVNLEGTFLTFQAAARHMVERGEGGSLVALSSIAAREGAPRAQAYAASKGGVISLVRACAVELARHRIRVNALAPGWIETAMIETRLATPAAHERILPRVPARRWGRPADLAAAAVYLAGPGSAYHTGDTLTVDGGYAIF